MGSRRNKKLIETEVKILNELESGERMFIADFKKVPVSMNAVSKSLKKMEGEGYVTSGESRKLPPPCRPRKWYKITEYGIIALQRQLEQDSIDVLEERCAKMESAYREVQSERNALKEHCRHLETWIEGGAWVYAGDAINHTMTDAATVVMSGCQLRRLLVEIDTLRHIVGGCYQAIGLEQVGTLDETPHLIRNRVVELENMLRGHRQ